MNTIFEKNKTPIWIMRQAGRYLPEYRELRKSAKNFLAFCYNENMVTEATMMPINRFDLDFAIIFSDILVILDALEMNVDFVEKEGPIIRNFKIDNIEKLNTENVTNFLSPVYKAIKITRNRLNKDKKLIGFAGAPWTLASYAIEGGSSKAFTLSKDLAYNQPKKYEILSDILTESIIIHIKNQIKAGVDLVMLFDSWAGVLNEENFEKWVIIPTKKIINEIKKEYPNIPIITFAKDIGMKYEVFANAVMPDILAIDSNINRKWIKNVINEDIILQGNLDPIYLLGKDKTKIISEVRKIMEEFEGRKLIFNLGHGILPETPIENVITLIETIRNYGK